ncbi:MAG: hypothetical protein OD815_001070 [Candidatus Alkanophagales archaeon MCA70_species_2]|nr:hypothetical protein [Candidatus Alkanophaga liquidiphilum]
MAESIACPLGSDRGNLGGDPAAGSPTATLLRLSPPCEAQVRARPPDEPSPKPHSGGLTGGVCKEQGCIHRAILRRDYYGFHVHEGELQPSIPTTTGFMGLAPPFGVAAHCTGHCSTRVARGIRGILTYRRPPLPPAQRRRSPQSARHPGGSAGNCGRGSRSLPDLTGGFTVRADDGHAPPLS